MELDYNTILNNFLLFPVPVNEIISKYLIITIKYNDSYVPKYDMYCDYIGISEYKLIYKNNSAVKDISITSFIEYDPIKKIKISKEKDPYGLDENIFSG